MRNTRVNLKNPLIAALLAYLIPGAGHWYQGRRFKATIYSVCILSLFIWGMILGNWQPVYSQLVYQTDRVTPQMEKKVPTTKFSFGYAAQFFNGAMALPALVQESRLRNEQVRIDHLDSELQSDFVGMVSDFSGRGDDLQIVTGTMTIAPVNPSGGEAVTGTLKASAADDKVVEYGLGGQIRLGREVFGSPRREIECRIVSVDGEELNIGKTLRGTISRSFLNWYQAPCDSQELDRLHGDLSRKFDIASVFTWIAGLLNLLAIWDAADGPAYGYGNEKPEDEEDDDEDAPKKP
ncbi:MAG: hypothetical protein NT138_11835 [Planctomycetales bacterium]|jgi:hypothetical protein|nr:hypothetical protein [Planctomycetales bacterium]